MQRHEAESLGDVLRTTLASQGLTNRMEELRAVHIWPAVVGPDLAAMMGKPLVNRGVMTIYVRSASLRHEMNMRRSSLVRIINETLDKPVITDIRFR